MIYASLSQRQGLFHSCFQTGAWARLLPELVGKMRLEGADSSKTALDMLHGPDSIPTFSTRLKLAPIRSTLSESRLLFWDYRHEKPGPRCPSYTPAWTDFTELVSKHCGLAEGQHGPALPASPPRPTALLLSSISFGHPALRAVPGGLLFLPAWNDLSASRHLASSLASVSLSLYTLLKALFPDHLIISYSCPKDTPAVSVTLPLSPACMFHHLTLPCLFMCILHVVCFPQMKCNLHQGRDFEPCVHHCILNA